MDDTQPIRRPRLLCMLGTWPGSRQQGRQRSQGEAWIEAGEPAARWLRQWRRQTAGVRRRGWACGWVEALAWARYRLGDD